MADALADAPLRRVHIGDEGVASLAQLLFALGERILEQLLALDGLVLELRDGGGDDLRLLDVRRTEEGDGGGALRVADERWGEQRRGVRCGAGDGRMTGECEKASGWDVVGTAEGL